MYLAYSMIIILQSITIINYLMLILILILGYTPDASGNPAFCRGDQCAASHLNWYRQEVQGAPAQDDSRLHVGCRAIKNAPAMVVLSGLKQW